jgi:hypothetical protein
MAINKAYIKSKPKIIGWFEEYENCGCVSETVKTKKELLGYCLKHGNNRRKIYAEYKLFAINR